MPHPLPRSRQPVYHTTASEQVRMVVVAGLELHGSSVSRCKRGCKCVWESHTWLTPVLRWGLGRSIRHAECTALRRLLWSLRNACSRTGLRRAWRWSVVAFKQIFGRIEVGLLLYFFNLAALLGQKFLKRFLCWSPSVPVT